MLPIFNPPYEFNGYEWKTMLLLIYRTW